MLKAKPRRQWYNEDAQLSQSQAMMANLNETIREAVERTMVLQETIRWEDLMRVKEREEEEKVSESITYGKHENPFEYYHDINTTSIKRMQYQPHYSNYMLPKSSQEVSWEDLSVAKRCDVAIETVSTVATRTNKSGYSNVKFQHITSRKYKRIRENDKREFLLGHSDAKRARTKYRWHIRPFVKRTEEKVIIPACERSIRKKILKEVNDLKEKERKMTAHYRLRNQLFIFQEDFVEQWHPFLRSNYLTYKFMQKHIRRQRSIGNREYWLDYLSTLTRPKLVRKKWDFNLSLKLFGFKPTNLPTSEKAQSPSTENPFPMYTSLVNTYLQFQPLFNQMSYFNASSSINNKTSAKSQTLFEPTFSTPMDCSILFSNHNKSTQMQAFKSTTTYLRRRVRHLQSQLATSNRKAFVPSKTTQKIFDQLFAFPIRNQFQPHADTLIVEKRRRVALANRTKRKPDSQIPTNISHNASQSHKSTDTRQFIKSDKATGTDNDRYIIARTKPEYTYSEPEKATKSTQTKPTLDSIEELRMPNCLPIDRTRLAARGDRHSTRQVRAVQTSTYPARRRDARSIDNLNASLATISLHDRYQRENEHDQEFHRFESSRYPQEYLKQYRRTSIPLR